MYINIYKETAMSLFHCQKAVEYHIKKSKCSLNIF